MIIKCSYCGKEYSSKGLPTHVWRAHGAGKNHNSHRGHVRGSWSRLAWSTGLTKETDSRLAKMAVAISKSTKGKLRDKLSDEHKKDISSSMKKAHAEGRAWNIGRSRWKNKPSYPEKFFMSVIENEFVDKDYVREMSFKQFSLDFAWPHKQKCIEIDGQQHQRFVDYQIRDQRKNKALLTEDWQILRIIWSEMFHNPKHWIQVAKAFVDN